MDPKTTTKFVIMMEGRVGSSFLISLLSSHDQVHCFHEKFMEDGYTIDDPQAQVDWLKWLYHDYEGKKPTATSIGFKIKFRDCSKEAIEYLESIEGLKIIFLSRRNLVKLGMSIYNYMDKFQGTNKANFEKGEKTFSAKEIDGKKLYGIVKYRVDQEYPLREYISKTSQEVLSVEYEDLLHNLDETLLKINKFLEIDNTDVSSSLVKATPDDLSNAISNYNEVKSVFKGLHLSEMFDPHFDQKPHTTILTLFSGRWHALEGYLSAILELDCDPKTVRLLWYTNANSIFVDLLEAKAQILRDKDFIVDIYHDQSVPLAENVTSEKVDKFGSRLKEELSIGASLYNAAWQHIETNDVLIVDDDVIITSHTLTQLQKRMDQNPIAAAIGVCVFDRYKNLEGAYHNQVLTWYRHKREVLDDQKNTVVVDELSSEIEPWGFKKVDVVSFSCALIRRSRLPQEIQFRRWPFCSGYPKDPFGHLVGADVAFCMQVEDGGGEIYCENDIRAYHFDSKGRIH